MTLGKYNGVTVTLTKTYSDDDKAVKSYENTLIKNASGSYDKDPSQKTVKKDSIVNVDYKGIKDGKAFDGGTDSDVTINVAKNSEAVKGTNYIDGFSKGLVGAKVGSTVSSKVTFPSNYQASGLAGKTVIFQFKVNYICKKVTADTVSTEYLKKNFSVATKKAFFDYAKKSLQKQNKKDKDTEISSLVSDAVVKSSKIKSYPKGLIDSRMASNKAMYKAQYFSDGMTWDDFYKQLNVTEEQFNKIMKNAIKDDLKNELIFSAVAEKEKIKFDQAGYDKYLKNLMTMNSVSDESTFYKKYGSSAAEGKSYLQRMYVVNKALKFCIKNAVVKPKA